VQASRRTSADARPGPIGTWRQKSRSGISHFKGRGTLEAKKFFFIFNKLTATPAGGLTYHPGRFRAALIRRDGLMLWVARNDLGLDDYVSLCPGLRASITIERRASRTALPFPPWRPSWRLSCVAIPARATLHGTLRAPAQGSCGEGEAEEDWSR
jgi:hypothetical protein